MEFVGLWKNLSQYWGECDMQVESRAWAGWCRGIAAPYSWGKKMVAQQKFFKMSASDFPGGAVVKNPPANAGDMGSSPGPGRSHMPRSN